MINILLKILIVLGAITLVMIISCAFSYLILVLEEKERKEKK